MATFTKQGKIKVTMRFDRELYRKIKIQAILADKTISNYISDCAIKYIKTLKAKI